MKRAALFPLLWTLAACVHAPGPGRGLWIGPIHACRDTVESAVIGPDYGGFPNLMIGLKPEWRALLQRETERLIGRPLPVRLNGRVISEPIVREPITGGSLSISGASEDFERMRAASLSAC